MQNLLKRAFIAALCCVPFFSAAQIRVKTYPEIKASYSNKSIQLSNANNEQVQTLLKGDGQDMEMRLNKAETQILLTLFRQIRGYSERIRRGERLTYADEVRFPNHVVQLTKYMNTNDVDYVLCINTALQEACIGLKPAKLSHLNELYREIHKDLFELNASSPLQSTPLTIAQPATPLENHNSAVAAAPETETVYQSVEEPPVLIGGVPALLSNLKYPQDAKDNNIEGVVLVGFMVDETGTVRNAKVIQSLGYGCDEEAMHLVENARFLPGLKHGNPVKVQMFMPFSFNIETVDR
jgi:TonB family protein